MFQFPGLAFVTYVFSNKYLLCDLCYSKEMFCNIKSPARLCSSRRIFRITEIEGGLPHSEILGSKLVRSSPRLIAAYHVLHRLSAPRHPPNALMTLDCSHYRRPPLFPLGRGKLSRHSLRFQNDMDNRLKRPFLLRTHPRAPRSSRAHYRRLLKMRPKNAHSHRKSLSSLATRRFQIGQDRMCFLFTMLDNPPTFS